MTTTEERMYPFTGKTYWELHVYLLGLYDLLLMQADDGGPSPYEEWMDENDIADDVTNRMIDSPEYQALESKLGPVTMHDIETRRVKYFQALEDAMDMMRQKTGSNKLTGWPTMDYLAREKSGLMDDLP